MAGLTKEQIKMLEGMPGIDQSLLSNYKANPELGANTALPAGESVEQTYKRAQNVVAANPGNVSPSRVTQTEVGAPIDNSAVDSQKTISDFNNFQVALNTAIDEARQQRKDSVLDMMGGEIPAGSLPATSFANVLSAFNNSAAPIEASLLSSATSFARDQIEREEAAKEAAEQLKEDNKNQIYQLALSVATETGDSKAAEMIRALAESGDMDTALKLALPAYGEEYSLSQAGGSIVRKNKDGEDETVFTYDPGTQKMTDGGKTSKLFTGRDDSMREVPYVDYTDSKLNMQMDVEPVIRELMGDNLSATIEKSLTDKPTRAFLNEYIEWTTATEQYWDPEEYFKLWMDKKNIPIEWVEPKEETQKKKEEEDKPKSRDEILEIPE